MGTKGSFTASKSLANSTVAQLLSRFRNVNLRLKDMVALSGAHTMGKARCTTLTARLQVSTTALEYIQLLRQLCSESDINTLTNLDLATPATFDDQYNLNLLSGEGLLLSDQNLATRDDQTRELVETYAQDPSAFFENLEDSMVKNGNLGSGYWDEWRRFVGIVEVSIDPLA